MGGSSPSRQPVLVRAGQGAGAGLCRGRSPLARAPISCRAEGRPARAGQQRAANGTAALHAYDPLPSRERSWHSKLAARRGERAHQTVGDLGGSDATLRRVPYSPSLLAVICGQAGQESLAPLNALSTKTEGGVSIMPTLR